MLADKSGLRRKPDPKKKGVKKGGKIITDEELIERNRAAGRKVQDKMIAAGMIPPAQVAEIMRKRLNTEKKDG